MVPSAKEIEFTVTALFEPTFLLSKVAVSEWLIVSDPTYPEIEELVVTVLSPS